MLVKKSNKKQFNMNVGSSDVAIGTPIECTTYWNYFFYVYLFTIDSYNFICCTFLNKYYWSIIVTTFDSINNLHVPFDRKYYCNRTV